MLRTDRAQCRTAGSTRLIMRNSSLIDSSVNADVSTEMSLARERGMLARITLHRSPLWWTTLQSARKWSVPAKSCHCPTRRLIRQSTSSMRSTTAVIPKCQIFDRWFFSFKIHFLVRKVFRRGDFGATENAGVENAIRSKMQGWKMQEWKIGSRLCGITALRIYRYCWHGGPATFIYGAFHAGKWNGCPCVGWSAGLVENLP